MTSPVASARLPGVYFQPPRRPQVDTVPALDVAAFVGYAQRGPLSLPVALEDASQYDAVFGGDVPLARDERGQVVKAYLPSAVRSFFAGGGRRCYAVRVAGDEAASAVFALPGTIGLDGGDVPSLALVEASTQGAWANRLRLATRLVTLRFNATAFEREAAGLLWRSGPNASAIQPGDVLRVQDAADGTYLVPVAGAETIADGSERILLSTPRAIRITPLLPAASTQAPRVARLTASTPQVLDVELTLAQVTVSTTMARVHGPDAASLRAGDWLSCQTPSGETGVLQVAEVRVSGATVGTPPRPVYQLRGGALTSMAPGPLSALASGDLQGVERLRFDCLLSLEEERYPALGDLSFGVGGTRFWGDVCLSESSPLFRRALGGRGTRRPAPSDDLPQAVAREYRNVRRGVFPRYPVDAILDVAALSGLLAPLLDDAQRERTYLPLSMATIVQDDAFVGPVAPGDDGLSAHSAASFLDASMSQVPVRTLQSEAWDRAYVQGVRLTGLHSLLLVDDVAMVAAPDAVHAGWEGAQAAPAQPPLPLKPAPVEAACPHLVGPFEVCEAPPVIASVAPNSGPVEGGTAVVIEGKGFADGTVRVRFGLKAVRDVDITVVSDTRIECVTPAATAPALVYLQVETANGTGTLPDAFIYVPGPSFDALPLLNRQPQELGGTTLLDVQRGLLAICQARQDMVALLSLPRDFERSLCLRWQETFRTSLGLPARSKAPDLAVLADLSFAAVYHPWPLLLDRTAPGNMRAVPPDGSVAGMIAARERRRGAFIAPANDVLGGAHGIFSDFSADDWAALFEAQFNLLRREPLDIRAMSAHTLSDAPELLQLSVRRLLILLRRAMLSRGLDLVFERNDQPFRDGIVARLRSLLQDLWERGALSGATPAEGYRITADATINTPQTTDAGQLIVLIQIAPSQPAERITVALTRSAQGSLQVSEV